MTERSVAAARLAASWLLGYPDQGLLDRLDGISAVVDELPERMGSPLRAFLDHLSDSPITEVQTHYVLVFDMKRKACPYLSYWTDGDTRNRGAAILRFKQAYLDCGYDLGPEELPDHLAVVLEFAAVGDRLTGEALLAEHQEAIHLLREALDRMDSSYVHVLDCVVATLPEVTTEIRRRMSEIAAAGPPAETVGLEPFGVALTLDPIGGRR
jgi:nitrate reductase molybdenum cofactor assembly chaperone NarJ/NarW